MANAPVEQKVKAATAVSFAVSLVVVLLNAVVGNSALLHPLPSWLQGLILAVAPPLATFIAGWAAPHSPRVAAAPEPPAAGAASPAA